MDKNQLNKIKNIVEAKNMKKMMFSDAELRLLAKALEVSMEWLVGDLPLFPL